MSQTIASVFVILLAQLLPIFNVNIGSDALTTFITTGATIIAGLWIWIRRYRAGDVKLFGSRIK